MSQIVRCPKCNSAVSVGPNQGGQRLQCPSCLQQFIAPALVTGGASATSEDEDWLSLDEGPTAAAATPVATPAPVPTPKQKPADPLPPLKLDDEPTDDVELVSDDTLSLAPAPTTSADSTFGLVDDNLFANLPSLDMGGQPQPQSPATSSSPATTTPTPNQADYSDVEESFRVRCPVCETMLYAKAHQSGGTIRCSDCLSDVRVPKPPRKSKKPVGKQPEAATYQFTQADDNRPPDPFKKSADELLQEAAKDPDEEVIKPAYEVPDVRGWLRTVFGIFLDLGVLFHFLVLTCLLAVPAAFIAWHPAFILGMVPLTLIGTVLTVSCGFAILQSVANDHDTVEEWPTADPTSWFDSLGMVFVATAISVGPTFALSKVVGGTAAISIAFVIFGVYTLFPFLLLSMMDLQSITGLFSPDVTKSVTRCQEDWGTFYFSSGMIFGFLMCYFMFATLGPAGVAIGVSLTIAVVFLYFAMLGRLAQAIGGEVELGGLDEADAEEAAAS
ncbi:MAG: hypothetical protein AAFX06_22975 [Planctomycetota bacterium]